jgi:hypothetical protein
MARQSTVDCQITSAALSRSQVRRRSEDVRDEMRLFGSCGSRDQPPTQRTRPTTCGHKLHQKPTPAAHESDDPSSRSLEGRACGDSPAEETSASCLERNVFVAWSAWCLPANSACDGGGTSTLGLIGRRLHSLLGANALVFVSVWCLQAGSCSGKRGKA